MEYNKLVRDRIPEIIAAQGEKSMIRVMDDKEYRISLEKKLDEEVAECSAQGHSVDELMRIYEKKHIERGGFSKRIFLLRKE